MKSFFFGRSDRPIYGVYHPPMPAVARSEGVLLCNPFGQEYMRAHRAFRQVATLLNRQGYHVMRFDYFGTGDSAGDGEEATVEQWLQDIEYAITELRAFARIETISLIGLRLGATLAGYISSQRDDLHRIVLWDPLLSGQHYVDEIIAYLQNHATRKGRPITPKSEYENGFYMNGFPLLPPLLSSLTTVDLRELERYLGQNYLMVVSNQHRDFQQLREVLAERSLQFHYQFAESPGDWNFVDNFGGVLIPHAIIQAIVNWFQ